MFNVLRFFMALAVALVLISMVLAGDTTTPAMDSTTKADGNSMESFSNAMKKGMSLLG